MRPRRGRVAVGGRWIPAFAGTTGGLFSGLRALPQNIFQVCCSGYPASQGDIELRGAHLMKQSVHRLELAGHADEITTYASSAGRFRAVCRGDYCGLNSPASNGLDHAMAGEDGRAALPECLGRFARRRGGSIHHRRHTHASIHELQRGLVTLRRFGRHHRLPSGAYSVQGHEAPGRRSEHDAGEVVVLEQ